VYKLKLLYHKDYSLLFQPILIAGWSTGLAIISPIADRKGRKNTFLRMTVFQVFIVAVLTIYVATLNPDTTGKDNRSALITFGILLFLVGVSKSNGIIGLLLLVEHLPKIHRTLIVTSWNILDSVGVIVWVLFFQLGGMFQIYIWVALAVQVLALIWAYRNLHESPTWLLSNGYNKKIYRYFGFLAKQNG
jgi:sugar phosphate permease